ncbi:MAG TPA: GNAT family N-acetyltransferase [Pseudomonadales bacterium]
MNPPVIRSATEAERSKVVDVILLAFAGDPLARWAVPNPGQYLKHVPGFLDAFGGNGLPHGTTFIADEFAGAALWLPPGVEPDGDRMDSIAAECIPTNVLPDFAAMFEQMAAYHPHEPHWYLPLIGVDPALQGRGYGAALMRHAAQKFDRDGAVAYLESSNPRNIPLYQRHGFEILGEVQVGGSPTIVPMLRVPR